MGGACTLFSPEKSCIDTGTVTSYNIEQLFCFVKRQFLEISMAYSIDRMFYFITGHL